MPKTSLRPSTCNLSASPDFCVGLPPIVTLQSRVLILGSMPGARSLALQQYYGHPQNAFWKIMSALFNAPVETYAQRVALIKDNWLAVWDSLKHCLRRGSLDSEIDDASIKVNDFAAFFHAHPKITKVFFNGTKSEKEFTKRVLPELPEKITARLTFTRLPSTSPAHAGANFKQKLAAWKAVKPVL